MMWMSLKGDVESRRKEGQSYPLVWSGVYTIIKDIIKSSQKNAVCFRWPWINSPFSLCYLSISSHLRAI